MGLRLPADLSGAGMQDMRKGCMDIDSVAGVLVYKYLANVRENKRRNDNGRKQKEL